jgi:hypothetical protein
MVAIVRVRVVVDDNARTVLVHEQVAEHGTVDHGPYMVDHLVADVVA